MNISLEIERSSVIFSNREETRDYYDASQSLPVGTGGCNRRAIYQINRSLIRLLANNGLLSITIEYTPDILTH